MTAFARMAAIWALYPHSVIGKMHPVHDLPAAAQVEWPPLNAPALLDQDWQYATKPA